MFGKHSRVIGSILSDESIPSHETALREDDQISTREFKTILQLRESARRAFHQVDNSDVLRRALLRRACPSRGSYQQGQWVMIWRSGQHPVKGSWNGPQRVIIQDGNHTVWTTQGGKLYSCSPSCFLSLSLVLFSAPLLLQGLPPWFCSQGGLGMGSLEQRRGTLIVLSYAQLLTLMFSQPFLGFVLCAFAFARPSTLVLFPLFPSVP